MKISNALEEDCDCRVELSCVYLTSSNVCDDTAAAMCATYRRLHKHALVCVGGINVDVMKEKSNPINQHIFVGFNPLGARLTA